VQAADPINFVGPRGRGKVAKRAHAAQTSKTEYRPETRCGPRAVPLLSARCKLFRGRRRPRSRADIIYIPRRPAATHVRIFLILLPRPFVCIYLYVCEESITRARGARARLAGERGQRGRPRIPRADIITFRVYVYTCIFNRRFAYNFSFSTRISRRNLSADRFSLNVLRTVCANKVYGSSTAWRVRPSRAFKYNRCTR